MKQVGDLARHVLRGGFPPCNAGASLKRLHLPVAQLSRGRFPPCNAGASLKQYAPNRRFETPYVFPRVMRGPH